MQTKPMHHKVTASYITRTLYGIYRTCSSK